MAITAVSILFLMKCDYELLLSWQRLGNVPSSVIHSSASAARPSVVMFSAFMHASCIRCCIIHCYADWLCSTRVTPAGIHIHLSVFLKWIRHWRINVWRIKMYDTPTLPWDEPYFSQGSGPYVCFMSPMLLLDDLICIAFWLSVCLSVWVCGTYVVYHCNGTELIVTPPVWGVCWLRWFCLKKFSKAGLS